MIGEFEVAIQNLSVCAGRRGAGLGRGWGVCAIDIQRQYDFVYSYAHMLNLPPPPPPNKKREMKRLYGVGYSACLIRMTAHEAICGKTKYL